MLMVIVFFSRWVGRGFLGDILIYLCLFFYFVCSLFRFKFEVVERKGRWVFFWLVGWWEIWVRVFDFFVRGEILG